MNQWKEAFWLSRYELKQYALTYFLLFICLTFSLIFIVPTIGDYMEKPIFTNDLFFILIFTVVVQWCRPKTFRSQASKSGLYVSEHLVMLNQLPIQKDIIIKHRLLSYMMTSLPFHLAFLVLLYVLTPALREGMPIGPYIAFSVFWICFGIYSGCSEPASETGFFKGHVIIRNLSIGLLIVFMIFIVFNLLVPIGLVHWIITISIKYTWIVIFMSILFAALGIAYWIRNMRKKMETMDYY